MSKKNVIYQSKEYNFPQHVWFFAAWLETAKDNYFPVFSSRVEESESAVIDYAREFVSLFKDLDVRGKVLDEVLLINLEFYEKFPLKQKYWKNPMYEIDEYDKISLFSKALRYKEFYRFVVTPSFNLPESNEVALSPAFTYLKGNDELIEVFMEVSKHPVFKDAKNAAIYNIKDRFGYDLSGDVIIKKDEEIFFN